MKRDTIAGLAVVVCGVMLLVTANMAWLVAAFVWSIIYGVTLGQKHMPAAEA